MVSMMNAMVYNGDLTFPTNKNGIFFRPKTRGQLRYITLKELDKEGYRTLWDFRTGSWWPRPWLATPNKNRCRIWQSPNELDFFSIL